MTKAERAYIEGLETKLAFSWPKEAEPTPLSVEEIKAMATEVKPKDQSAGFRSRKITLGWFVNAYSVSVTQGWSDGVYHSQHNTTGDMASQRPGIMYATKREAALAMRWEMCRDFATKLRRAETIQHEGLPI